MKTAVIREDGRAIARKGILSVMVTAEHPEMVLASADHGAWIDGAGVLRFATDKGIAARALRLVGGKSFDPKRGVLLLEDHNAYVNTGLNNALDRESGAAGTAIGFIGVSSNTTAVTASTVNLNGASGGTAPNTIIKSCTNSRSAQTTTYTVGSAFVNADFTSGVFVWNKVGLLNTSTDAGTGLIDVIGGTGGSSPYNRAFSLDLTAAGTFSVTLAIAVTATAV